MECQISACTINNEKIGTLKGGLKWSNEQIVNPKRLIEHLCACTYERGNVVIQINFFFHFLYEDDDL